MDAVLDAMERQGEVRKRNAQKSFADFVKPDVDAGHLLAAFVEMRGEIGAAIGAAGRLSDLIVVASSQARWEQPFRPVLDAALRQTGRPVFVTPPSAPEKIAEVVAVAWNDTPEAARALAGAVPLLKTAKSVIVLTCQEDDASEKLVGPSAVAEYLGMHGVKATSRIFVAKHRRIAREIIDAACAEGADLLVLGSVIHSRAHSLVFGSLTEEVLKAPRMCALLVP
jgi:nucleotide-binding universal stress UspA family protein